MLLIPLLRSGSPLALLFLLVCLGLPTRASVVLVSASAPGPAHDGASWSTAFLSVQAAVTAAAPGDEIWVARGAYKETVTLRDAVSLYGGFAGSETSREQRDPSVHASTLDGEFKRTVLVSPAGVTAATVIDGMVITRGNAVAATPCGGVYCVDSSPIIRHNSFVDNNGTVSTILATGTASPLIENNRVTGGTYTSTSCIKVQGGANATIRGNTISETVGNGIAVTAASALIEGNTVTRNIVKSNYVSYVYGSGLYLDGATATVSGNTISSYSAKSSGGGIYCSGGAVTITSNTIDGNRATNGGGLYLNLSSALVSRNTIVRNAAGTAGGGVYINGGAPLLRDNEIFANLGASTDWRTPSSGAGIYCKVVGTTLIPVILNNTIVSCNNGGAVYWLGAPPKFWNNIVAWNSSPGSAANGRYTCLWNNPEGSSNGTPGPDAGGNIRMDPKFANLTNGDFRLLADSPCRGAGDPSLTATDETDFFGKPRTLNGLVDIGMDESDGAVTAMPDRIIRVRPGGNDANDGSSWELAKATVPAAAGALALAGGGEVWVAAGEYAGAFTVPMFGRFYSGFDGSEAVKEERKPREHRSRLLGQPTIMFGADGAVFDGFTVLNEDIVAGAYTQATVSNNEVIWTTKPVGYAPIGIASSGNSVTLRNNFVRGAMIGIEVFGSGATLVAENHVVGSTYRGIETSATAGTVTIQNNVVAGSASSGIDVESGTATLINNSVIGAGSGGAVHIASGATVTAANNILADSDIGLWSEATTTPVWKNNCVYTPAGVRYSGTPDRTGTQGNVSVDPGLDGIDYGGWKLRPGSMCVNAGDNTMSAGIATDLEGEPRIIGGRVDIGADEQSPGALPFVPRIIRVAPGGNDSNDGSSWSAPKATIQGALAAIASERDGCELWVAAGWYPGNLNLQVFAWLYGGFAGNETTREQRDFRANASLVVGDGTKTVIVGAGLGRFSTVDGFTVTGGSWSTSGGRSMGGGIDLDNCSIAVRNNQIIANTSDNGGAAYLGAGANVFEDNVVSGNSGNCTVAAGSVSCKAVIRRNSIVNNMVTAINVKGGVVTVIGNLISGNSGGGIGGTDAILKVLNNTIISNHGTAISAISGGTIANNLVARNMDGIYSSGTADLIANNTVAFNVGVPWAGGITVMGTAKVSNNTVAFDGNGIVGNGTSTTLAKNCVSGNTGDAYRNLGEDQTASDIKTDPLFRDAANGDFTLADGSPCRDAGSTADRVGDVDLAGSPRVVGSAVDIGAYEWAGPGRYSLGDVVRALLISAGVTAANEIDDGRLGVAGDGSIGLRDAVSLARKTAGLEPNP